jgi:hypothetical protein
VFNEVFSERPERREVPATRDRVIWATPGSSMLASHESNHAPPGLAHHNPIVGIPDGAVVDRYQESVDLGFHPRGRQRSRRIRLPMFAAIGKFCVVRSKPRGRWTRYHRPARRDALSVDQSWARQRRISGAASLNCYPDSQVSVVAVRFAGRLETPQLTTIKAIVQFDR